MLICGQKIFRTGGPMLIGQLCLSTVCLYRGSTVPIPINHQPDPQNFGWSLYIPAYTFCMCASWLVNDFVVWLIPLFALALFYSHSIFFCFAYLCLELLRPYIYLSYLLFILYFCGLPFWGLWDIYSWGTLGEKSQFRVWWFEGFGFFLIWGGWRMGRDGR